MMPPMPGMPKPKTSPLSFNPEIQFGAESQGGGPQPMQPMPFSGTDAQPMAQPMGKPDGGQLGVIRPMPELGGMPQPAQGLQPP